MSATMTAPEQVDGLEKLLLLASLRKEDIAANAEEARKQIQLTNEQLGKVAEAKAYIAQYAALRSELQGREDTLAANRAKHELDVKQHAGHVTSENVRLETFAATLTAKEKELADVAKNQLTEADRLRGLGIDMNRQHQEAMSGVQKQEAQNNSDRKLNAEEKERLQTWENTLKKKAQNLREQAANF